VLHQKAVDYSRVGLTQQEAVDSNQMKRNKQGNLVILTPSISPNSRLEVY